LIIKSYEIANETIHTPLATRLTKNINDENDNEKYYLTTKTKTKNPLMKRHCKLEGIYFSLPAFALSGN
jgi:type III secretory pathway component EscR